MCVLCPSRMEDGTWNTDTLFDYNVFQSNDLSHAPVTLSQSMSRCLRQTICMAVGSLVPVRGTLQKPTRIDSAGGQCLKGSVEGGRVIDKHLRSRHRTRQGA